MKRYLARIMALAMTLCLFGAAAKAVGVEDYSPMPTERCKLILPEGCVLDEVRKDGYLEVSLNRSRTDWSTALATGYNFSNRQMHCQIEITPPDNEHTWHYASLSGNTEMSKMISLLEVQGTRSEPFREEIDLGRYDKENKIFEPSSTKTFQNYQDTYGSYILCKWVDENNNVKREYLRVETASKTWPVSVEVPMAEAKRIIPDGSAGVSSAVSVGQVDYTLKPFSAAYKDVETRIKAPKGASRWRNADVFENDAPKPIQNGEIQIVNRIEREHATRDTFCIQWMDDAGETVMYEMVDITAAEENIQLVYPGAKYAGKPVDADRLVVKNGFPPLLSTPYQPRTGEVRLTPNAHVSGEFPKFAWIEFEVEPPKGATYLRSSSFSSDMTYGTHDDQMAAQDDHTQKYGNVQAVSGNKAVMVQRMSAFRRVSMVEDNGAELTWFTPANVPSRFSGNIVTLCWYGDDPTILDDAGQQPEPIKREYFCITADPFLQTVKGRVFRDLSDLTLIKIPVLVINEETEEELTLIIGTYPQSGFNATYYEISLDDSHGNAYELKNNADLYLPYPENGHMDDNRVYTLRHYVEDGDEEYIYEKLEKTPLGLRAQVSSFSPFVLSWQDGAAPKVEDLPATGDTSRMGLYLAVFAGACFLLAAMRRSARKRA